MTIRPRTAILGLAGLLVATLFLFPYAVMAFTSLKPNSELFQTPGTLLPGAWQWSNYFDLWDAQPVAAWMGNSVIVTITATAAVMLIAIPAAFYLARNKFAFRTPFLIILLVGQMITPTIVLVGLYREMMMLGLVNTLAGLVVVNVGFHLSFAVWLLSSYFKTVPEEIEEAALVDGCGRVATLVRIVLPISGPGLVTVALYTFVAVWNEYVVALTLINDSELLPISVGITRFTGEFEVQWQFLFATAVLAVAPVVVMFASIEKHLVGGLTAGAVK